MADMTNYLEEEILDFLFRNEAIFSIPTTVYVGLHTADPAESGTAAGEVSGGAYVRKSVDGTGGTNWADPVGVGSTNNVGAITFAQATAAWGTISHVSIWGTSSGGTTADVFLKGSLTADKPVASGDTFQFAAADLDISMA